MPAPASAPAPAPATAAPTLTQRLQRLQKDCGGAYDVHTTDAAGGSKKKEEVRERRRLQGLAAEQLRALSADLAAVPLRISAADLELLLRLLPSLAALAETSLLSSSQPPLRTLVARLMHRRPKDGDLPSVDDAVLAGVLLCCAHLLHRPEDWAAPGDAQHATAVRAAAAFLLSQLLPFFVSRAQEAVVEAQWRQWQAVARNALLTEIQQWVDATDALRTPASQQESSKLSAAAAAAQHARAAAAETSLSSFVALVDALTGHPCARGLPSESWPPLLISVARLAAPPSRAPQHLELTYGVLQALLHAREHGVVTPGVWRQVSVRLVAVALPHSSADAPAPIPVSDLARSGLSYATLFLQYVHLTKALCFVAVEESATGSSTARDTAAQLHSTLSGLVQLAPSVFIQTATAVPNAGCVSLLAAVVKDLLTVRQESRSVPRQYARYVQGMLAGAAPLVPHILTAMAKECQEQVALLASSAVAAVVATNAEVLQGVLLWSIHAVVDEGLLDVTRRSAVAAALPWKHYEAASEALRHMEEHLALVLLSTPSVTATSGVPLLAARVIACAALNLLLNLVLFVFVPYGIADEVSCNARFRTQLFAAETRVMRIVAAFDCGATPVLHAFTDAVDELSSSLGPVAAKVSALLPNSTRPALVTAGCHGALDKLLEVIPIF